MLDLNEILANDSISMGGVITLLLSACLYLWKKYEKYLLDTIKKSNEQSELVSNVSDLINQTNNIFVLLNKTTEDLQSQIDNLENRLKDLSNLDIRTQNNLALLLKDIENIKAYIQAYNSVLISKNKG
jgi:septal ring factor EnvC (AmiA/AmiB activator)